ncbi:MFS transporter [Garicola koreensis]|uniref:DHA2 family multidrug resistance protein-like MFS transporter n=1 Tax=Garicola koreensis TaxID=1262554 RepID=A0A7W5Y1Q5_9MICC|nr:DHA2 family multidrug resistance protein-like MFS transporter [Garicola koreensis]
MSRAAPVTTVSQTSLPRWQRWTVLGVVSTALLLIALDNTILYTALPTLSSELEASSSEQLWIINAYPLLMAGLLLGSGSLGDRFGHKRIFQVGLLIFGAASLAAAFAPTAAMLVIARALLGVGAAAMMPATLALIRITFSVERERNVAIGVWSSTATIGMALGPIVSGALLERFWWGSVFLINVPLVIAASVLIILVGPANLANPARRWDGVSSMMALVGMGAAVLALKTWAELPVDYPLAITASVVAVMVLFIFTRRQLRLVRSSEPLVDFSIFTNRGFSGGVVAAGISIFGIMGIQLVVTQRYQLVEGFTPLQAGLVVSALAVAALPFALFGGAVLHRAGLLVLIGGGLSLAAAGGLISVLGAWQDSLGLLIVGLLGMGAGLGAAMSVASSAIMGNVPPHRAGMAASLEEVSYEFGGLVGVATMGSLLTLVYTGTLGLPGGAEHWAERPPAAAVGSQDASVVAAAAESFDLAYLVVLAAVAVVMLLGALCAGLLLRRYTPGSQSQQYPNNY